MSKKSKQRQAVEAEVIEGHMEFAVASLNDVQTDLCSPDYQIYLKKLRTAIDSRLAEK
ncbi:MAG: hypothetical protein KDI79_15370 [Anaerolineae bacterium]|nr:hypothetical protein [Anaerolineae bacterium]